MSSMAYLEILENSFVIKNHALIVSLAYLDFAHMIYIHDSYLEENILNSTYISGGKPIDDYKDETGIYKGFVK